VIKYFVVDGLQVQVAVEEAQRLQAFLVLRAHAELAAR
jgi:hypothetical protein